MTKKFQWLRSYLAVNMKDFISQVSSILLFFSIFSTVCSWNGNSGWFITILFQTQHDHKIPVVSNILKILSNVQLNFGKCVCFSRRLQKFRKLVSIWSHVLYLHLSRSFMARSRSIVSTIRSQSCYNQQFGNTGIFRKCCVLELLSF